MKVVLLSSIASLENGHASAVEKPVATPPKNQPAPFPFHGILKSDGNIYSNWGLSNSTKPAVYAEPISYEDVQAIVKDTKRFPTPVSPVGAMLSVSQTIVNDGGTLLCTTKLDEIIGLETDGKGRKIVRVQAGSDLKSLIYGCNHEDSKFLFKLKLAKPPLDRLLLVTLKILRWME